ncbi:MAG: hypothetical protein AB7F82_05845 [Alphaproteobacteria bacterium]
MPYAEAHKQRDLYTLHNMALFVLTHPKAQDKWVPTGDKQQLIHKIGHTFTTVPDFDDTIHDELTAMLQKTFSKAGFAVQDVAGIRAMIDREEGDITIDIPQTIFNDNMLAKLAPACAALRTTTQARGL